MVTYLYLRKIIINYYINFQAMLLIYFQSEIMEYTYQVFLVGIMLMMIILFGFI